MNKMKLGHKLILGGDFIALIVSSLLLSGCDSLKNNQPLKTINSVLLNDNSLIYLVDNELYQYDLMTEEANNIFSFDESAHIQFEISQDLNKVIFQVVGEDDNKDEFIILSFDNSTGEALLTQVDSLENTLEPDEQEYGKYASVNHSGNKIAVPEERCVNLCHLSILELEEGVTIAEHFVDYAGESYPRNLWSPDDRFLAYLTFGPYGFNRFKIFDTTKDQYGTGEYLEDSGYYDFKSYSTSVSAPGAIDLNIYNWIDENTIVLKTIEELGSAFWTYNADTESLQEIASVKSSDEWIIQDASISKDLKTISYIKARGNDNEEQELWISNTDGSNASLIYKNYEY